MTPAEKIRARSAVMIAVENGTLAKPNYCTECGRSCSPHGHHEDYAKPLAVVWLCAECHRTRHGWRPDPSRAFVMAKVRLPEEAVALLAERARASYRSTSDLIRDAVVAYLGSVAA